MSHYTSRRYQNVLHISGTLYSFLTILGAVLIGGKENIGLGIILMATGAAMTRVTSEIEYRKQEQLFKEFRGK